MLNLLYQFLMVVRGGDSEITLGASLADIWATTDLINTIELARAHKPDVDARILWNKYRASTSSSQELTQAVEDELKLREIKIKLGYRVAYSDAYGEGLTVMEWTDKVAKKEMRMLGIELRNILHANLPGDGK